MLWVLVYMLNDCVWPLAGPQRTSPTVPKNMPTPQRVQHNTPAMRKNPSLSRNGGSDAEIMELNQQVIYCNESHHDRAENIAWVTYWINDGWILPFFSFFLPFLPKLMELKLTVDGLEKERDFYFSKLRDIELICQEHESENNPILSKIIDILYATEVSAVAVFLLFALLRGNRCREQQKRPTGMLTLPLQRLEVPDCVDKQSIFWGFVFIFSFLSDISVNMWTLHCTSTAVLDIFRALRCIVTLELFSDCRWKAELSLSTFISLMMLPSNLSQQQICQHQTFLIFMVYI